MNPQESDLIGQLISEFGPSIIERKIDPSSLNTAFQINREFVYVVLKWLTEFVSEADLINRDVGTSGRNVSIGSRKISPILGMCESALCELYQKLNDSRSPQFQNKWYVVIKSPAPNPKKERGKKVKKAKGRPARQSVANPDVLVDLCLIPWGFLSLIEGFTDYLIDLYRLLFLALQIDSRIPIELKKHASTIVNHQYAFLLSAYPLQAAAEGGFHDFEIAHAFAASKFLEMIGGNNLRLENMMRKISRIENQILDKYKPDIKG